MTRSNEQVWRYKDSERTWWKLVFWDTGDRDDRLVDTPNFIWAYEIYREGNQEPVYHGSFEGQYDIAPMPEDFMLQWLGYLNGVVVGFGKYGQLEA